MPTRWIVHYKSATNKHLVIHHTVYHRAMVTEALVQLRAAAEAIGAEVKVLFDEDDYEFETECAAKLEVRVWSVLLSVPEMTTARSAALCSWRIWHALRRRIDCLVTRPAVRRAG